MQAREIVSGSAYRTGFVVASGFMRQLSQRSKRQVFMLELFFVVFDGETDVPQDTEYFRSRSLGKGRVILTPSGCSPSAFVSILPARSMRDR